MGSQVKACPTEEQEETDRALKEARKIVKSRIRRAMKVEGTKALQSSDSNDAWKFIRAATFTSKGKTDIPIALETLNRSLADIVQAPDGVPLVAPVIHENANCFVFQPLSVHYITRLLCTMKANT